MPKKKIPSPNEWRQWLDWREEGLSEVAIARKAGREIRTVRKYLAIAADERRKNIAQLDLVKDALKTHQDQLMGVVNGLSLAATVPSPTLRLPWPLSPDIEVEIQGGSARFYYGQNRIEVDMTYTFENSIEFSLLKEHLPSDPVWAEFKRWKIALWSYLQALATYKEEIANKLIEKTGGRFVDENLNKIQIPFPQSTNSESVELITATVLELIYKRSLKIVLESVWVSNEQENNIKHVEHEQKELEERLKERKERGELRFDAGVTLALCPNSETARCKDAVISTTLEIISSKEARHVASTYKNLCNHSEQLQKTLYEIKLGILIMGECRVCSRLKG